MNAWAPLRHPVFRAIWTANLVSNLGGWMQNVAAVWLMTTLSGSALMVALVQTASSLPVFLVGLLAGALADLVDRRILLLITQVLQLLAAAALAALSYGGHLSSTGLLLCTFLLGLGSALSGPAWVAITPELVDASELSQGVALNGISTNLARAIGPALAGLMLAFWGAWVVFAINAVSFIGVIVVLATWKRPRSGPAMDGEHVLQAVVAGLRYVSHSLPIRAVIVRVGLFVTGASAFWALLPLVAVQRLHLGPGGYGALLGGVGTGAVLGALALPRLRTRLSLDTMLNLSTAVYALCGLAVAWAPNLPVALLATLPVGVAWIAQMASFNVTAQRSAARWVQARALALYLLVFQGGLAGGSAVWGGLADGYGASWALTWGSLAVLVSTVGTLLWRLDTTDELDLTASNHWAEPMPVTPPRPTDGPVLITVECQIDPEKSDEFRDVMRELEHVRRRDGAYAWSLYSDPEQPGHMLETFLVSSWAEHMRQHHRGAVADVALEERVRAFHVGTGPIIVHHYLAQSMARIR